jgi:polyferredoxin
VCPTGIDIRNGLQMDCIACAQCIDACDEVMDRLGRARGLVRYDSLRGLDRAPRRVLRPPLYVYAALGVLGLAVATLSLRGRKSFEANMLRAQGAPYMLEGGAVRNVPRAPREQDGRPRDVPRRARGAERDGVHRAPRRRPLGPIAAGGTGAR